ncbi:hypothetical protein M5K25_006545 [Dendrobium thyrsiflorum]|uniref:Uncharacterized protein n=1 Tax=Dendrobium thyrsiflorum TaxID=117978 RepID=A0ABD0VBV3_DENTH
MAAKKVDALEERLEGEMNQIKTTVEERMSSMEGQVADLRDMIKKMLEVHNQTTASVARNREEEEAEIVEGRRPHLETAQREERGGYGGYQSHRNTDFEERRREDRETWPGTWERGNYGRFRGNGGEQKIRKLKMPIFERRIISPNSLDRLLETQPSKTKKD